MKSLMLVLLVFLLNQCAPKLASTGPASSAPRHVDAHWRKVSSRPPTFYPRGVSEDCPTDWSSGDWVHTYDALGSRYFIPLRVPGGVSRSDLVKEALSLRMKAKPRDIELDDKDDRAYKKKVVGYSVVLFPLNIFAGIFGSRIGPSYVDESVADFRKRWIGE